MQRVRAMTCALCGVLSLAFLAPGGAATLAVPAMYATIGAAISAAADGDEVVVSPGIYFERLDFNGKAIAVRSTNPSDRAVVLATVLYGGSSGSTVTFEHGETGAAVLEGFYLKNGRTTFGGGIRCTGASPTIRHNILWANYASARGGAIACLSGASPLIESNTITVNQASSGGAICCVSSSPTIRSNFIDFNHASWGSGIYCEGSAAIIENNVLCGNGRPTAEDPGPPQAAASRTRVSGAGGGIYATTSSITVRSNTLYNNKSSTGLGSGLYVASGTLVLTNSIVASTTGSGLCVAAGAAATVTYCDVYDCTEGNYVGMADPTGSSGNISVDPLFADVAHKNFRLRSPAGRWTGSAWVSDFATSPCLDAGDPVSACAQEPSPNGGVVNLGYDGNTAYASKTPPLTLLSAKYLDSANVDLLFSKRVDEVTAETAGNYAVSGELSAGAQRTVRYKPAVPAKRVGQRSGKGALAVASATLAADGRTVRLTLAPQTDGVTYTITVTGVRDALGATVAPGADTATWTVSSVRSVPSSRYPTIQAAIDAAASGDTIVVAPGTYHERPDFRGKSITVQSVDPGDRAVVAATTIDGDAGGSVVTFAGGETLLAVLAGFTITNGCADYGAGVKCLNASPTILGNVIRANTVVGGGTGAGIYCNNSSAMIEGNTISGNTATAGSGAGVYCEAGTVFFSHNLVTGNISKWGAGVECCRLSTVGIEGNTISDNRATTGLGGGILMIYGGASTINNTIVAFSTGDGVAIYSGGSTALSYCDVYDNSRGNYYSVTDPTGTAGNLSLDPLFADRAAGDYHLKSTGGRFTGVGWVTDGITSPCVDAGDPAAVFLNEPQPNGGRLNMGPEGNTREASRHGSMLPSVPATLTLVSPAPTCESELQATAGGSQDPRGGAVTYDYQWALGEEAESAGAALKRPAHKALTWGHDSHDGILTGVNLHKGEVWQVRARATGLEGTSAWTEAVATTIGNSIPAVPANLTLGPAAPVCSSVLTATAGASSDADLEDTVSFKYEWAEAVEAPSWGHGSTDGVLSGVTLHRGERWQVRACATDGTSDSAWTEPVQVTIGNSPPVADPPTVSPASPRARQALRAAGAATDPDGDALTYTYQWSQWETAGWGAWAYESTDGALAGVPLVRDERWKARVRATDGTDVSAWVESAEVRVGNAPPTAPQLVAIAPRRPTRSEDLKARVTGATDPDGDPLVRRCQWSRSTDRGATWSPWGDTGLDLSHTLTAPGEWWRARGRVYDGEAWSPWCISAAVIIRNTASLSGARLVASCSTAAAGPGVAFTVTLSGAATVEARVCNLAGRVVAALPPRALPAGSSQLCWNGRSASATALPAGRYLVRLTACSDDGGQSETLLPVTLRR